MPSTSRLRAIAVFLFILFAPAASAETLLDRLPFKIGFSGGITGNRSGRHGRPLKPIEQMDYNDRELWDKHPYPSPKLTITFPF